VSLPAVAASEQAALGQRSLGEQLVEVLDAPCGMETLIERIVQVANIHRGFFIACADILQRTHGLPVLVGQCQTFRSGDFLGTFAGSVEGGIRKARSGLGFVAGAYVILCGIVHDHVPLVQLVAA
jgi:hypothetical protein